MTIEPIFALALLASPLVQGIVQQIKNAVVPTPVQTLLIVFLVALLVVALIQMYFVGVGSVVFGLALVAETLIATLVLFSGAIAYHKQVT
jgi:hypothetical protein